MPVAIPLVEMEEDFKAPGRRFVQAGDAISVSS
jgi:hypothetical protein